MIAGLPLSNRVRDYPESEFNHMLPDEAEMTAGVRIEPGKSYGFFTDTTVCIGCKACEVACKEWNNLPADSPGLTGDSYDNTGHLPPIPGAMSPSSSTWPKGRRRCSRSRATG